MYVYTKPMIVSVKILCWVGEKRVDKPLGHESQIFFNGILIILAKQTFNGCLFGDDYPTRQTSRTLFGESCLSPPLNSSLSSRRPSFNASAFGSPTFVDRTLSTKRILNSPFYAGRTTYGGASAYSRSSKDGRGSLRSAAPKIQPVNKASTR